MDLEPFLPIPVDPDPSGAGPLDKRTCLDLLRNRPVGRLGFSAGALPVVVPVSYVLAAGSAIFRSEPGEKAEAAAKRAVACLEVGGFTEDLARGWSVLATGRLEPVEEPAHEELRPLAPGGWRLDPDTGLIALSIELVSGRVFTNH